MPVNPESEARLQGLLTELAKNGVHAHHRSKSVYCVNNQVVSLRTTTKPPPKFWYDISQTIMNGVQYILYQTDSAHHFTLFPSIFFKQHYTKLQPSNRPTARIFYIQWLQRRLISEPELSLDISSFCCSLDPNENFGPWRQVFLQQQIS